MGCIREKFRRFSWTAWRVVSLPVFLCALMWSLPSARTQVPGSAYSSTGGRSSSTGVRGYDYMRGSGFSYGTSRASMAGSAAYRALQNEETAAISNALTAVGPVKIAIGSAFSLEYNDNINVSSTDVIPDLIARPQILIDLGWQITKTNNLRVRLDLGYDYYFNNEDNRRSQFTINPDTVIEFNMFVGDFRFQIYDIPQIQTDPANDPTVSNAVNFNVFQNVLGASVMWDANDILMTLGAQRQDIKSLNSEFQDNDSYGYLAYVSLFVRPDPLYQFGMRATTSYTIYTGGERGDTRNTLAGLIFQMQLSPYTTLYLEGGVQFIEVDSATGNGPQQGFNRTQPYYDLNISNRLNRYLTHYLSISQLSEPTFGSELNDSVNISYGINYLLTRRLTLNLMVNYVNGADILNDGQEQDYSYIEFGARASYQWLKNWTWFLEVRHINRLTEDDDSAYTQNRVSIGFEMMF